MKMNSYLAGLNGMVAGFWWMCFWLKNQIKVDANFLCQGVRWDVQKGHVLGPNVLVQTVVNIVTVLATLDSTFNAKVFFIFML